MEELIKAMSDEELERAEGLYKANPKVMELLKGIIEGRKTEAEQAKLQDKFSKGIEKLFGTLAHPDGIHNVYACWCEVDVPDGEPEEVEVVDSDGNKSMESRQPTHREHQWVVKVNHATKVTSSTEGKSTTSKRAITVKRIVGDNLVHAGNFASASKACEHLGLTIGGDSAMRVLSREGYLAQPYEGSDYTA